MTDHTQEARKALQDNVTALKARSYRLDTRDDLILLTKMNRALLDVLTQTPNALDDKVTAYQKDIAARLGKRMTDAPAITPEIHRTTRTAAEGIVDKVNAAKDRNQAVDYITALILHAESLQQSHDVPSIEREKALPAEVKAALNGVSKQNIYSTLVKLFEAQGFKNTAMFLTDPSTLPTASTPAIIIDPETKTSYPDYKLGMNVTEAAEFYSSGFNSNNPDAVKKTLQAFQLLTRVMLASECQTTRFEIAEFFMGSLANSVLEPPKP